MYQLCTYREFEEKSDYVATYLYLGISYLNQQQVHNYTFSFLDLPWLWKM